MKNYIGILSLFLTAAPFFAQAQTGNMGIATTKPRTTMDVNGTINVKNEIRLGGTDSNAGNAGNFGNLLSANGNNNPEWTNFDLPAGYGNSLVLNATYLMSSETGVVFNGTNQSGTLSVPYDEDQGMVTPTTWKEITGVAQTFTITKLNSSTSISVQTLAQVTGGNRGSFGLGIFIDDKLKFVRAGIVIGGAGSYKTLNINASIPGLSVGTHTFKLAAIERSIPVNTSISVGEPAATANLNNKMAATSVSIKVFEPMN
ncbi:hypothetical protein ACQ7CU_03490 [Chryseobacterium arthrosphaerae]|uniref:hypothetical protein n=1 Tax=Chryseobacterium arthrosphaerae TaxID=651561 RepID=UPI003D35241A